MANPIPQEVQAASRTHRPLLLLTTPEAARNLSVSPRKLWALTASGEIPCVRIGRAVRYSVNDLANFVAANTKGGQQ